MPFREEVDELARILAAANAREEQRQERGQDPQPEAQATPPLPAEEASEHAEHVSLAERTLREEIARLGPRLPNDVLRSDMERLRARDEIRWYSIASPEEQRRRQNEMTFASRLTWTPTDIGRPIRPIVLNPSLTPEQLEALRTHPFAPPEWRRMNEPPNQEHPMPRRPQIPTPEDTPRIVVRPRCNYCGLDRPEGTGCTNCSRCARCCEGCTRCGPCGDNFREASRCSACQTHSDCCGCWSCNTCDTRHNDRDQSPCHNCGVCDDCCQCVSCTVCHADYRAREHERAGGVSNWCTECRPDQNPHCTGCCREACPRLARERERLRIANETRNALRQRAPVAAANVHMPIWREWTKVFHRVTNKRTQLKRNALARTVGVEIEVDSTENYRFVDDVVMKWGMGVVRDGSIGSNYGFEVNTAPAGGDFLVDQLEQIGEAFVKAKAKVTERCGVHVHVGAEDLTYWDIRKLVHLYAKVEDALYGIIDQRRRTSQYCLPCGPRFVEALKNPKSIQDLKSKLLIEQYGTSKGAETKKMMAAKYASSRYFAMNLHSWHFRGTIEFRHHHGTVKTEKFLNWSLLLASLVDTANKLSDDEVSKFPGGKEGLLRLAPTPVIMDWVEKRYRIFNPPGRKPIQSNNDVNITF